MSESTSTTSRGLILPDWLELILRLLVGGVFIYASVDKILHPGEFAHAIHNYRLVPMSLLHASAVLLPWLELVAGVTMLIGFARRGASALVTLMLLMFMAGIFSALSRDLDISCGCFHTKGGHAVGLELIFRDIALLAGALVLWFSRGVRRSF